MKFLVKVEGRVTATRRRNMEIYARDEKEAKRKAKEAFLIAQNDDKHSAPTCTVVSITAAEES